MTRRAPSLAIALVLLGAGAAQAARITAVTPACAGIGAAVTVEGRGLGRGRLVVGGVGALDVGRGRRTRTVVVPAGLPPGATTLELERGRRRRRVRASASFRVAGPEQCNGADDDCDGAADDLPEVRAGAAAGAVEVRRCVGGAWVVVDRIGGPHPRDGDACVPDTIEACWEGPPEARGIGVCRDGVRVCGDDGVFGPCTGAVLPGGEDPGNGIDENCDGRDGPGGAELCVPGALRTCYDGAPATRDVGECRAGLQSCGADGRFRSCDGQVLPAAEVPENGLDENCDGLDVAADTALELQVDAAFSPTFQLSQVISGSVGSALAPVVPPAPAPLVASVSPRQARQRETLDVTVTIEHAAFDPLRAQLSFGPGVTVGAVTVVSPTVATARVAIAPDAGIGPRLVAVSTGAAEAIAANAFRVRAAAGAITGVVQAPDGSQVAGATVCIGSSATCVTTAADGSFTLPGVPTDTTRLAVRAPGFADLSIGLAGRESPDVDLGALAFERTTDEPPPPPQPGAPVLPDALGSVVARGATLAPESLSREQARRLIVDTILLVGGAELGVRDAAGTQQNPDVTGDGLLSLTDDGVERLAAAFTRGEGLSIEDLVVSLAIGWEWPGDPPSVDEVLAAWQARVDEAWSDPGAPESAAAIAIFNPGPRFTALAPVLGPDSRLSVLQGFLLHASLLVRSGQAPSGARALAPLDDPPLAKRQLSRLSEGIQKLFEAIGVNEFGSGSYVLSAVTAFGATYDQLMTQSLQGSRAQQYLEILQHIAQVVPAPPVVLSAVQEGGQILVRVRRTPDDTPERAASAGVTLGSFTYTLYRYSPARPNQKRTIVAAAVSRPELGVAPGTSTTSTTVSGNTSSTTTPPGYVPTTTTTLPELTLIDPDPEPGLNHYYVDVVQHALIPLPAFFSGTALGRVAVKNSEYFFPPDLVSDYSTPNPFDDAAEGPMIDPDSCRNGADDDGDGAADGDDPACDPERDASEFFEAPDDPEEHRFGRVGAVRGDRAETAFVSDTLREAITRVPREGEASHWASTGFRQSGLAIDALANLYTENAASDPRYGGRLFQLAGGNILRNLVPDTPGERRFVGTVVKYSPLLDRANPVSVPALTIGPPNANAATALSFLGDVFAADDVSATVRRVPTSFIPPEGIEALGSLDPTFGPLVAPRIVGDLYAALPECDRGPIVDLEFASDLTLYVLTRLGLYRVPYDAGTDRAGAVEHLVTFPCPAIGTGVRIRAPEGTTVLAGSELRLVATGAPCDGDFTWDVAGGAVELIDVESDLGTSTATLAGRSSGRAQVSVSYGRGGTIADAAVEVTVP